MAIALSPYTWRIVLTSTYTSSAAADSAVSAFNSAISGQSVSPRSGRFSAGINKPSSTVVTLSYEADDEATARALSASLLTSGTTNRTAVMTAVYRGNTA